MSVSTGLGLLLSTIVAALLLLYYWTRDRWKWRKIALVTSLVALGVGGLSVAGFMMLDAYSHRAVRQETYSGVTLGMTRAEVAYSLGKPFGVLEPLKDDSAADDSWRVVTPIAKIPEGRSYNDFQEWYYEIGPSESGYLAVAFSSSTQTLSKIACSGHRGGCASILGIAIGASEESVKKRFGNPTRETLSGETKRLEYPVLNLSFWLKKRHVYMLGLIDSEQVN